MKSFSDKVVVITGAGSGIGRSLALEFGRLGAQVALNDHVKDTLEETASILRERGVKHVYTAQFDVSDRAEMHQFALDIQKEWGNAHVIVNNAGIEGVHGPAYLTDEQSYRRIMDINFFGVLNGCQAFLPQLVANNEGAVVNISSIFGLVGMMNYSGYSASKFAVRGYTEALMAEFHKSPISIHCVHPGGIKTNISTTEQSKTHLVTPPEDLARYIIKSVKKRRSRIVYGHGSSKIWLSSKLIPQRILKALIWRALESEADPKEYGQFINL